MASPPSPGSFPALEPYGWNDRWRSLLADLGDDLHPGRVLRHHGSALQVITDQGSVSVRLGPALEPPPAVGDWVALDGDVPVAVLTRTSLLRRRAAIADQEQPLVANVDVVLIVCGLDRPVKAGRIRRVATLARDAGAVPVIVLTKVDLVEDPSVDEREAVAANPGLAVIAASTRTGVGVATVRSQVCDRTATLIGESGAGKSSLVNALTATPEAVTAPVRTGDAKGRHTTTARSLHLVAGGGVLVDTPGIRAVGLWVGPGAVTTTFADLDELAAQCRFNDCQHHGQPGCAVTAAVEAGEVAEERLVAWRELGREANAAAGRANAQTTGHTDAGSPERPATHRAARDRAEGRRRNRGRAALDRRVGGRVDSLPMALSYDDATARITAPGQRFETTEITVNGVPYIVFRHAPSSLRDLFSTARQRGGKTFLVYEDERWSFARVMSEVDALGATLVERYGVQRGDRVAISMRNFPEWIVSFAAITSVGAISVSMNAWWTEDELEYALGDCGATVLIADAERLRLSRGPAGRLGFRTIAVRCGVDGVLSGADRWEDVVRPGTSLPVVDIDPDDDATILYTSGTTGRPKGAVSTHRAVVQALLGFGCRSAIDRLRRPEDQPAPGVEPVFILIVPLFHVTGCVPVMLSCFAGGLKLVIMYKWEPERALELIERERVTNFVGVPTQSWDLLESPRFADFDTSSLVSVGGGGAPAPPELVRRVAASFTRGRPSIGYGMTETNAYGPGNSGIDYTTHPTSTGRATPILQLEVRDTDGRPLPVGDRGEIWFKGPNLIRGYWNRPDATDETIVDGWLRTGDIGHVDDEDFVYVEDRAKDMVIRAGENVYCAEVEASIYEHPAVYEAAVFGVPHERLGEEVAAAVYPRSGQSLTVEALQAHLAKRLAPFKIPTKIMLVTHPLPRNPAGKVLKRELRDAAVGG